MSYASFEITMVFCLFFFFLLWHLILPWVTILYTWTLPYWWPFQNTTRSCKLCTASHNTSQLCMHQTTHFKYHVFSPRFSTCIEITLSQNAYCKTPLIFWLLWNPGPDFGIIDWRWDFDPEPWEICIICIKFECASLPGLSCYFLEGFLLR